MHVLCLYVNWQDRKRKKDYYNKSTIWLLWLYTTDEIRDLTTLVDVVWGMPQCVSRTTTTTNHWGELYLISHASANVSQSWGKIGCWRNGVWGSHYEWSFFDVRIFNPFTTSNRYSSQSSSHLRTTNMKRRRNEVISMQRVEHASFSPLLF